MGVGMIPIKGKFEVAFVQLDLLQKGEEKVQHLLRRSLAQRRKRRKSIPGEVGLLVPWKKKCRLCWTE